MDKLVQRFPKSSQQQPPQEDSSTDYLTHLLELADRLFRGRLEPCEGESASGD